jgi:hypothetical protein
MAIFLPSANVEQIRGSVGHINYSRVRSGAVTKKKSHPGSVNPFTPSAHQINRRDHFRTVSLRWQQLDERARYDWNEYASQIERSNVFGQHYFSSGFNCFVSCNINRILIGLSILDYPVYDTPIVQLSEFFFTLNIPDDYSIDITYSDFISDDGTDYLVYLTAGVPQGLFYCKNKYRLIDYFPGTFSGGANIYGVYPDTFPYPASYSKIFCKLTPIQRTTCLSGIDLYNSVILDVVTLPLDFCKLNSTFILF